MENYFKNIHIKKSKYYLTSSFIILFIQNFLFFSSHGSLKNLSPYLLQLGLTKSFIGFFMNLNAIGLILFVLFLGHYVEYFKKKNIILITYILQLISYIIMFFNSTNVPLLIFLRIIGSFSFAAGFTINASIAFNFIPVEKRTGGIALFGISGIISNPISAYLGEKVILTFSYKHLFLLGSIFSFLAIIFTLLLNEDTKEKNDSNINFLKVLKRKELSRYFIYGFILGGAFSCFDTFIPPLTYEKFQITKLSLYFVPYAIITIFLRIITSKEIDRVNHNILLLISFLSLIFASINMGFLVNTYQIILSGFLYGITHTILYPLLSSTVVKLSLEKDKYLVNSSFISCYIIGSILISTILGKIADIFNKTEAVFFTMSIIGLISLLSIFIGNDFFKK